MAVLIEQRFSTADHLAEEIELLFQIASQARSAGRSSARLWLSAAELRQESATILNDVQQLVHASGTREIDPDDHLTDRLLAMQTRTRQSLMALRAWARLVPAWTTIRWMLRKAEKELRAEHRNLGLAWTLILEHDADVSPVLAGRFATAEALVEALEKDAA